MQINMGDESANVLTEAAGCEGDRVAEVTVTDASGRERRGSGYRVTSRRVLTAAHVVNGATGIMVRFHRGPSDQWTAAATLAWSDPAQDLAVLDMDPPESA